MGSQVATLPLAESVPRDGAANAAELGAEELLGREPAQGLDPLATETILGEVVVEDAGADLDTDVGRQGSVVAGAVAVPTAAEEEDDHVGHMGSLTAADSAGFGCQPNEFRCSSCFLQRALAVVGLAAAALERALPIVGLEVLHPVHQAGMPEDERLVAVARPPGLASRL